MNYIGRYISYINFEIISTFVLKILCIYQLLYRKRAVWLPTQAIYYVLCRILYYFDRIQKSDVGTRRADIGRHHYGIMGVIYFNIFDNVCKSYQNRD